MPYDYFCESCQRSLEAFQKITERHLEECPECKKRSLKRRPGGGIGLSFSGPGFYVNDYTKPPASNVNAQTAEKETCCPCGKKSASPCQSAE
jgi:putative FmdB family regulatory protein